MTRTWTVGALARLAGVSVRTLHWYDEIALLRPSAFSDAGYRLYGEADLARLHLIRLYRAADLPLEEIRRVLDAPGFERDAALKAHRQRLVERLDETRALLQTVDRLLEGAPMSSENLFDGFEPEAHAAEAEERWGHTDAHRESRRRTKGYTPADWTRMRAELDAVEAGFAAALTAGEPPDGERARAAAEAHRRHIDRWFYPCDAAMHGSLAEMYVTDPRFTARYEARAPGLAVYVAAAIRANAARRPGAT